MCLAIYKVCYNIHYLVQGGFIRGNEPWNLNPIMYALVGSLQLR